MSSAHVFNVTDVRVIPAVVKSLGRQLHSFEAGGTDCVATAVLIVVSRWHPAAFTTLRVCVCVWGGGRGERERV